VLVLVSLIPLANMVLLAVRGRAFRFVKSSLKAGRHRLRLAAARSYAGDGIRVALTNSCFTQRVTKGFEPCVRGFSTGVAPS
jgi:hypothetical protein